MAFIFENDVHVPSKSNKQKKQFQKKMFFVGVLKVNNENSRIRRPDPDPLVRGTDLDQNVTGVTNLRYKT
jgi:hypothetical protein